MPGITKLIGIYDADGGIFGEIKYFAGKFFSNKHCSLCDITHGKSKKEWAACEKRLPITIDFIHLNERNSAIEKYTNGVTPVSYTHLRAHETKANLVCRLLLE